MKKHLVAILIIVLVLSLTGVGIWLVVRNNKTKPLYQSNCDFIISDDVDNLTSKMNQAQGLYNVLFPSENRITTLHNIIVKIDGFEKDLNSYLLLSQTSNKASKKLSKSYTNLINDRKILIKNYDEYITRMNGNLDADGPAIQELYDDLFGKTVTYLSKYNDCFNSTTQYVFSKVYQPQTIKNELYTLYSLGVSNLIDNISNYQFGDLSLMSKLHSAIKLSNGNIYIKQDVIGGEFSMQSLNFQKHFNNSNLSILIDNFHTYYGLLINPDTETSNEKLAIYYAKQILEI